VPELDEHLEQSIYVSVNSSNGSNKAPLDVSNFAKDEQSIISQHQNLSLMP
jgi:hypothetical protein